MEEIGVDVMQLTGRENYHYLSGDRSPTEEPKRALKTYVEAQNETLSTIKPGMSVGDITKNLSEVITKMPYKTQQGAWPLVAF